MHNKNLPVPYHQQDRAYYCGAACAQMVLGSINAGIQDQFELYANINAQSKEDGGIWYAGPDGLEWALNEWRPLGFNKSFKYHASATEDQVSRKVIWTIED